MAVKHFSYFLIVLFLNHRRAEIIHFNIPEVKEKDFSMTSHLKYQSVWQYCYHRNEACHSNNTNICAVKKLNNKNYYKDFKNGCFLFLSNMCDHPEEEYFIVTSGSCDEYLATRRSGDDSNSDIVFGNDEANTDEGNPDDVQNGNDTNSNETDQYLRKRGTTLSTLYEIDTAYDYHLCPHSCPNTYSPVCVNVNRGFGKYFKLMTFVNHCYSDVYYCKNWREFAPPPNEDENVRSSPLSWSFCGASRYLQFARFAEATSAMSHYGWLAGDFKYSHIMEPHERIPGFG